MTHSRFIFAFLIVLLMTSFTSLYAATTTYLYVGQTATLSAPDPPYNTALYNTAWGCNNANVSVVKYMTYGAKVTVNSYFTEKAEIRCDYYYYWYDNNGFQHVNHATTYFYVECKPVSLTINPTYMQLNVGEGQSINYSYSPSNVTPQPTIRFSSSNTNVATVNNNGYVYAVGSGNATITVLNSSGPNATCNVMVNKVQPTSISLPHNLSLLVGDSYVLTPTVYPPGAQYSLVWASNNKDVASVSEYGVVTAHKVGSAQITANIYGYSLYDYCNIIVDKPTLTLSATPTSGQYENEITITLTANNINADIYYTLDGNSPNQNSNKYEGEITINHSVILKAIAYHEDYNTSNILCENYEVSSLKTISSYPENGSIDMGRNIIPSILFNFDIKRGEHFEDISLTRDKSISIPGERVISGSTLFFVPDEDLEGGHYTLTLPTKSVTNRNSDFNFSETIEFNVFSYSKDSVISADFCRLLKSNGTLYVWGPFTPDKTHQLHSYSIFNYPDTSLMESLTPIPVLTNIRDFTASDGININNYYVLTSNDSLLGWGGNYDYFNNGGSNLSACEYNILGDGTTISRPIPVSILSDVSTICSHKKLTGVIKNDKSLWMWGPNESGQVGNGHISKEGQLSPTKVLSDVDDVLLGSSSIALKSDRTVWGWGYGMGDSTTITNQSTPILKVSNAKSISSDGSHVLVLKNDGTVWSWGYNVHGQIGNGTTENNPIPTQILSNVRYIDAYVQQNIAIKEDNSLWRWGWCSQYVNNSGADNWLLPTKILDSVVIAKSDAQNCFALKEDKSLWGMGSNRYYILGTDTTEYCASMIKIMDDIINFWHTSGQCVFAKKTDGSLWGWGIGKIGNGLTYSKTPVKIMNDVDKVWNCDNQTFVRKSDGTVWGWGNYAGDGTVTTLTPQKIMDGYIVPPIDSVSIVTDEQKSKSLPLGDKLLFQARLVPSNGEYESIRWSIDDENIAFISSRGFVTARARGRTKVRLDVRTPTGTFRCSHDLNVGYASELSNITYQQPKCSIVNNLLHIENCSHGELIRVYSPIGTHIYSGSFNGTSIDIPLPGNGIYIIQVGRTTIKVANN